MGANFFDATPPEQHGDAMHRYERARDDVAAQLAALEPLLTNEESRASVTAARERLKRGKFVLAVIGEFSSGKSFLLNALLEKFRYEGAGASRHLVGMLATDINPSTAAITEIDYAPRDEANALFEDGHRERIPFDALNRFIAVGSGDGGALHDATEAQTVPGAQAHAAPVRVLVQTSSPFLERGFVLADTPGLASANPAHRRATLGFLPVADAVLYLIDTQQPFSEGDAAFLGIVRAHIDSIFIVQTKIDLWQDVQSNGASAWESAYERIRSLAAVHAPGTYVYAVSARDYAEGTLNGDAARVERSHFAGFLGALDASLIGRTGRARLRRASEQAAAASTDAIAAIDADHEMLALGDDALRARRAAVLPELDALGARVDREHDALLTVERKRSDTIAEQGHALADNLEQTLAQAFDTADVARLRDRARLHVIVDRATAQVVGEFAASVAQQSADEIERAVERVADVPTLRFSLNDAAARAFGGEPGTSLWSGDVRAAIAAAIVLEAVGGPSIAFVQDVASRFARATRETYMKRELTADLRTEIFPRLRDEMLAFASTCGERVRQLYDRFGEALHAAALAVRDARLGSIDRALAAHASGDAERRCAELAERRARLTGVARAIAALVEAFLAQDAQIAPSDPVAREVRAAHADPALDRTLYDKGLRPERYRVAVLGALRRGKSSLINAFAGAPVLDDDVAGSAVFPIHVRYAERDEAFALGESGTWSEIPTARTITACATAPVLRLTPWKHPRELVLVHAPAFDSGRTYAEDVNMVVAGASSAVLCLFSRQLSDRELALYERVAELGKPMIFVHTIADNESASERRNVVELAARYLRERNVPAERIFTVSAQEFAEARGTGRAPAGWNELGALIATIESQTESHMNRLARLARSVSEHSQVRTPATTAPSAPAPGLLGRLFGRRR